jgi:periplasmic divalent cation tolerance protein
MSYHVVFCTCPDETSATTIANMLIDRDLAACVNIVPGLRSIYRWKSQRKSGTELLLIIKSRVACYADLQATILELHPYELPEIIALPISTGLPAYLAWIGHDIK